jgi:hypothetical protein
MKCFIEAIPFKSETLKRFLLIIVLLTLVMNAFSQGEDAKELRNRIPVLGKIVASDSLQPIRNTHVISKMAHCGTISNLDGVFFIPAKSVDTLWVSCLGYRRRLIPVDSTMVSLDTMLIVLHADTITLKEVSVFPFYDYKTFKQMIIDMPSKPLPKEIQRLNEELAGMKTGQKRNPYFNFENGGFTASPIQYLYDQYNASARRQKKLLRNRRMFNEILREQGRIDELLPDSLDYSIDYRVYEDDSVN